MLFIHRAVFALVASILSVGAQITPPPVLAPTGAPPPPPGAPGAPGAPPAAPGGPALPLTEYHYTYPNLPEQVDPYPGGRGPQSGYNICNSTTEGPSSMCQTMFVNSIDDFCLWGSPTPNGVVGNIEGEVVAYCTKPGYGTRLIAPGALTAVQFIKTPGYVQVTGLFDQTSIGVMTGDSGGELDPHGADLAGNPIGGLVFSNNLPSSKDNKTFIQVMNWNNFIGSNVFCIKACDPTVTSPNFCENTFDTQGCSFNMPASYAPNEFTSCLGENQQPAGAGAAPPIPASSSCTTYTSSLIYRNAPTSTTSAAATAASATKPPDSTTSKSAIATNKSSSATSTINIPGAGFFAVPSSIIMATFAGVLIVLY